MRDEHLADLMKWGISHPEEVERITAHMKLLLSTPADSQLVVRTTESARQDPLPLCSKDMPIFMANPAFLAPPYSDTELKAPSLAEIPEPVFMLVLFPLFQVVSAEEVVTVTWQGDAFGGLLAELMPGAYMPVLGCRREMRSLIAREDKLFEAGLRRLFSEVA